MIPEPTYPPGGDLEVLKRLQRRAWLERERRFFELQEAFLRDVKVKAGGLTPVVDPLRLRRDEVQGAFADQRKAFLELTRAAQPVSPDPLPGDNRSGSAPFDLQWSSTSSTPASQCNLYGPSPTSGEVGADIGIFHGGEVSSVSGVGFWYYAQQSGTLIATVHATVWGRGYVFSGLFGYAQAVAALRVYVERFSPDFAAYAAMTEIYNHSGTLTLDFRTFDLGTCSASIVVPLRAKTWYVISGEALQHAYAVDLADCASKFNLRVGPVTCVAP